MRVHRDAAPIVPHLDPAFGVQGELDAVRMAGDRFVHGVVEQFGGEMVEPGLVVEPIYMPGRRRTGSRPSRTSTCSAV